MKDRIFAEYDGRNGFHETFCFDKAVTSVFDDMVERSVPGYRVAQGLLAELAGRFHNCRPIYDLGCSTGNTLHALLERVTAPVTLVGVDSSAEMLEAARAKLDGLVDGHELHLVRADLESMTGLPLGPAGVVILCLTLQFLRPIARLDFLGMLREQTAAGGCLLLVEKTVQGSPHLNEVFIDCHYDFKRSQGYSELEIARKREALENRLIPYRPEENLAMLRRAGYQDAGIFFTHLNFQGYVAVKGGP